MRSLLHSDSYPTSTIIKQVHKFYHSNTNHSIKKSTSQSRCNTPPSSLWLSLPSPQLNPHHQHTLVPPLALHLTLVPQPHRTAPAPQQQLAQPRLLAPHLTLRLEPHLPTLVLPALHLDPALHLPQEHLPLLAPELLRLRSQSSLLVVRLLVWLLWVSSKGEKKSDWTFVMRTSW